MGLLPYEAISPLRPSRASSPHRLAQAQRQQQQQQRRRRATLGSLRAFRLLGLLPSEQDREVLRRCMTDSSVHGLTAPSGNSPDAFAALGSRGNRGLLRIRVYVDPWKAAPEPKGLQSTLRKALRARHRHRIRLAGHRRKGRYKAEGTFRARKSSLGKGQRRSSGGTGEANREAPSA